MSQLTVTGENYTLHLADCMDLMAKYPDGHFDLAVVDPPYGIGMDGRGMPTKTGGAKQKNGKTLDVARNDYSGKIWDSEPPPQEYFDELRRVSKNQIVWGANHFIERIPINSPCWIIWDKVNQGTNQSDGELAWTSFKTACRKFEFMWSGMCQGSLSNGRVMEGNKLLNEKRIHPTQKPVQLYKWLLANYAKPGMKVLDTHLGSGSIAIAAHYAGIHLTACEIDPEYFAAATARIERETMQTDFINAMNAPLQPEQISFKMEGTP
jgi:site-specific DNA-methyltransferase (adenine-specific)